MGRIILLALIVFTFFAGGDLHAQRGTAAPSQQVVQVTLFSPLPADTPWGRALNEIASAWARVTNGEVILRVQHGITQSESTMRLSLDSNTIQAAVFTSVGLSSIEPSIMTVSAPFLIRNETELGVVMREIQGDLEARINRGDFFIIAWSQSGFVNIFSREPVFSPDDLRRSRIASGEEMAEMNHVFRAMGFQVVEGDMGEIGLRLAQGQVTAIYTNPAMIAAGRLHTPVQGNLRNMLSTNIAPVLGGIVINQVTWRRIGALNPRYQQEVIRVTREIAGRLDQSLPITVNNTIQTLTREGLTVNRINPAQEQLWFDEMTRALPSLIGGSLDMNLYNRINDILTRHRGSR